VTATHTACYWVKSDRFLAGEYPGALNPDAARRNLQELIDMGVTRFIDLTESGELEPYKRFIDEFGLYHVSWERFSIRDVSVPESPSHMTRILDAIDEELAAGGIPYVHCWGGIGRTGTVVGCWFSRHGHPGADALTRLEDRWKKCRKSGFRDSPETDRQRWYVMAWSEDSST